MKLRYVGPFDEVEVLGQTVVRNGTLEAVGEDAERLLEQKDNFKRATPPKKQAANKAATSEPSEQED